MVIAALVLLISVDIAYVGHRKDAARQDVYQSVLDQYKKDLRAGMTRAEAQAYLQQRRTQYSEKSIANSGNTQSDLIKIGIEPTRKYRGNGRSVTVYIALDFSRANKAQGPAMPRNDLPVDSDVLAGIRIVRGD